MLKVPAYEYFAEHKVTVYQDDTLFWKFYMVPDVPSLRRDALGNPVFLLIKYAFGDQDRAANPNLPRGGGYCVFDVDLAVGAPQAAAIAEVLQRRVDEEWRRLKAAAEARNVPIENLRVNAWRYVQPTTGSINDGTGVGMHGAELGEIDPTLGVRPNAAEVPPGDAPPKVILSVPDWAEGTVSVSAPQSAALVTHRVANGQASLVGSNAFAANLDLTEPGATFMQRTLVEVDGSGATDTTPIQVTYDLKVLARQPPVNLHISADTRSLYKALTEIEHDYDGHDCEEDDMKHFETRLEAAVQSGLIQVKLDAGLLDLGNDFLQELRANALKIVQDMIKDKFYDRQRPPAPSGDDPTAEFAGADRDIYYLKQVTALEAVHFEYHETIEAVTKWPMRPQGTMQAFLAGLSKEDLRKYVREIKLDDDFFKTLNLRAACYADFENEPIDYVDCQVRYVGRDETGANVEKLHTFHFDKQVRTELWDVSLIDGKREYEYRWQVGFVGGRRTEFTPWARETTDRLAVSVVNPGKLAVRVVAGNIDFAQSVRQVQVQLRYRDPSLPASELASTVLLADGQLEQRWSEYLFAPVARSVEFRPTFVLKDGQRVDGDWVEASGQSVVVNEPALSRLRVLLMPVGDWGGVTQSIIDLKYDDTSGGGYHVAESLALKTAGEFREWRVLLGAGRTSRQFQYKVTLSYADGTFVVGDWSAADGDQTLPILARRAAVLDVDLLANLLDFSSTPVVECTMRYDDPVGDVHAVETFALTANTPQKWRVALADPERRRFRYVIKYHRRDGDAVTLPEVSTDETAIVLPRLQVPEVVVTANARPVDFQKTPVVEATFEVRDEAHDIDASETLVFSDAAPQTIRIPTHEDTPREYRLTVTYYPTGGAPVSLAPVSMNKKQIVIPAYVPQA